jgi:Concanavalin A-like lectin/glucanases superfamily
MLTKLALTGIISVLISITVNADPSKIDISNSTFSKDKNTIILLHFNENKGAFTRDYGKERDIYKISNHKWVSNGQFKSGINFLQNNLKIANKKLTDLTELTLEAWVNWKGSNGKKQYVFYIGNSGENGFGVLLNKEGKVCLRIGGKNQIATEVTLASKKWIHLALIVKDNITSLYINGQKAAMYKYGYIKPDDLLTLSSNSMPFNGNMDELRFSDICRYSSNQGNDNK